MTAFFTNQFSGGYTPTEYMPTVTAELYTPTTAQGETPNGDSEFDYGSEAPQQAPVRTIPGSYTASFTKFILLNYFRYVHHTRKEATFALLRYLYMFIFTV